MAIKFSQFNLRTESTPTMYLVGYDGNQNIHITVDNLISDIIDGTENTIAMFGPGGNKVIDSMLSQDVGATLLTVGGQLNVGGAATFDTSITVTGDSTLNGNVTLGTASDDLITQTGTLYLQGIVQDTNQTSGAEDQILVSDAGGLLNFQDLSATHVESAEVIKVPVKNLQGSGLTKGDPVYISGSVGESGKLEVKLADASNSAKMPAVGLLFQDLGINSEGYVVITGKLRNLTTDPIDGLTPLANDVIYVKPGGVTGDALTLTKPTGSNLIQNMGKVGRVSSANSGNFVVSSILRTNDIPNLTPGKIWVGSTGNTIESQTLFVDEANERLGIGITSPQTTLHMGVQAANPARTEEFRLESRTGSGFGGNSVVNLYTGQYGTSGVYFGNDSTYTSQKAKVEYVDFDNAIYYSVLGNSINYHYWQNGGSTQMTLKNSFLGIGTTTPTAPLHIQGGATSEVLKIEANANPYARWVENGTNVGYLQFSSTNAYLSNMSNGSLLFRTNNTDKMTITGGGNVGIGTTNPGAMLHIEGDGSIIRLQNNSSDANGTFIDFRDSTGSRTGYVGTTGTSDDMFLLTQGAKPIRFYTDAAERMRIDSSGVTHIMGATASVNNSLQFAYNSTAGSAEISAKSTTGNTQFEFYTSNAGATSERVRIDSNGNVGIGTTNPGQKLDVSGNIKMTETAAAEETDKFVVLDSGVLKYRTGAQVISELPTDSRYVAVVGDTMTGALTVNAKFTANDVDKHAPSVVYDADAGQVLKNEDSELAIGLGSVYPTSVNYPLWVQGRKNDDTARNICLQPVDGSVQIGVDNFNGDKGSLATGYENEINGKFSFATGKKNVLGTTEVTAAIGRLNEVNGLGSTAIGNNNTVTKKDTVVIGRNNTANNEDNFILGFANTTQKIQSIAVGRFNDLDSAKIVSVGHYNTSSGTTDNATSFGYLNESLHSNSHLFGQGLESSQEKEIIIGKNNAPPSNPTGTGTRNANVIIGVGTGQFAGATMNAVEYYGFNDGSMQVIHKALYNANSYANDTDAGAGGVPLGGLYRHNNDVKIRMT